MVEISLYLNVKTAIREENVKTVFMSVHNVNMLRMQNVLILQKDLLIYNNHMITQNTIIIEELGDNVHKLAKYF